jgi:Glycosyl hydrolase family 53
MGTAGSHHGLDGPAGELTRRSFLGAAATAGLALALPAPPAFAASARGFRTSLSVSPFTEGVLKHLALTDGVVTAHSVKQVQQLFVRHGATEVYARIATRKHAEASGGQMGFALGLERARLAKQLGLPFNPELGLWAVYGDAEGQPAPDFRNYPSIRLPGPWASLTIDEMATALRHYGALVARQIKNTGAKVNYWDLGNEVEFGIAGVQPQPLNGGPYSPPNNVDPAIGQMETIELIAGSESDRIAWLNQHLWPYVGRLLLATAEGIRSVERSARFSTHVSGIFENTPNVTVAFWEAMAAAGYKPDLLGTSFYASSGVIGGHGNRFTWLKQTAAALQRKFHKKMFIAEMGYPTGRMQPPYPYNTPLRGYPLTAKGQDKFIHDVVSWGVHSGHLAGVRPWAPDLCTPSSHWQPMSFFVPHRHLAKAKPALDAISQGLGKHRA